jgi:hypothetical protein
MEAVSPASPQTPGATVTFTASSSGCAHPLYQFWLLRPGSPMWQVLQTYSAASTYTWNTAGLPAGNYLYTAWVRDASSSGAQCSYLGCNDAYMPAATYTLEPPCTSVTETAAPASPQLSGSSITFTASAATCPHPVYQFWALPPGSSTWQVVQSYSTGNVFTWNTAGLTPGSYLYTVWARDASSAGAHCTYLGCNDAFMAAATYNLTQQPCTSGSESVSPAGTVARGTAVSFTATAAGCPHPMYQFWILAPGSTTWKIVQPYSTSNTFSWYTNGLPAGTYMFTVWVRDASSTGIQCSSLGCDDAFFPGTEYVLT